MKQYQEIKERDMVSVSATLTGYGDLTGYVTDNMEIIPITFRQASKYIALHHRHHYPPVGSKFCIAVSVSGTIVGVAVVGRPVSRRLDDGRTAEVTRLCTDGTKNACSKLYGAAWRIAREMGYRRIITYILESESGTSLKAAGWQCAGRAGGLQWRGNRRPKKELYPPQMKIRYEKSLTILTSRNQRKQE